jgi:hypothetical protein
MRRTASGTSKRAALSEIDHSDSDRVVSSTVEGSSDRTPD